MLYLEQMKSEQELDFEPELKQEMVFEQEQKPEMVFEQEQKFHEWPVEMKNSEQEL